MIRDIILAPDKTEQFTTYHLVVQEAAKRRGPAHPLSVLSFNAKSTVTQKNSLNALMNESLDLFKFNQVLPY